MQKFQYFFNDTALSESQLSELRAYLLDNRVKRAQIAVTHTTLYDVAKSWQQVNQPPAIWGLLNLWTETTTSIELSRLLDISHSSVVTEHVVMPYKDQKGITAIEGSLQVATFKFNQQHSHHEHLNYWRNEHAAIACDLQTTLAYTQNYVAADNIDAVVEELFPVAALTNPLLYFAAEDKQQLKANMATLIASSNKFIDMSSLNVSHLQAYQLI